MATVTGAAALGAGGPKDILAESGFAILTEGGNPIITEASGGALLSATAGTSPGIPSAVAHLTSAPALHAAGTVFPAGSPTAFLSAAPHLQAAGTAGPPGSHLAAAPVLGVTARNIATTSVHLSVAPSLSVTGFVPTLLARPVLSATAGVSHVGSAHLAAAPALSAATSSQAAHLSAAAVLLAPGRAGAVRMFAGTALTVSGTYFMPGAAALSAAAHLTAAGKAAQFPRAALAASTALHAAALVRIADSAALHAPGTLTAAASSSAAHLVSVPVLAVTGSHAAVARTALTGSAHLAAAGRATQRAAAALHAPGSLSSGSVLTRPGRAALRGSAGLTATGATHAHEAGAAVLAAAAVLRAAGLRTQFGAAHLLASPALTAVGARTAVARAHLSATPVLAAAGQDLPGVQLHAQATLGASATVGRAARTLLAGGGKLSATAHGVTFPKAAFTAPGVFTPVPNGIVKSSASFATTPSLLAGADTRPKLPFPVRPKGQQPTWQRDAQRWSVVQERMRHAQALWQYGELGVFALMWRPEDIGLGLARRCTRCYTPGRVVNDLPPDTAPPLGWPTAGNEAQISAAYGQGNQYRCPLCFGTQVIAAGDVKVPGLRALLVRPAILTDADQNQQRSAKGVVNPGTVQVQSTVDFRVHTLDYFIRSDGRRYQLAAPARTTLRTGFASPWQASAGISYNLSSASLEDPKASVAYVIPPDRAELGRVLGTYTRLPADFAWFEQVNGPLIPGEDPPPAAYGHQQPDAVLGA